MQIDIGFDEVYSKPHVHVVHKNEKIRFCIGAFDRTAFSDPLVFKHINEYWQYVSPTRQEAIFQCYKALQRVFDEAATREELTSQLNVKIIELTKLHPLEDLKYWIELKAQDIFTPTGCFDKVYVENIDKPGSREQTYVEEDYNQLVTMILGLRALVPIWGEYISRTRQDSGTLFKEYYTYKLLHGTHLADCPGAQKLLVYIEKAVANERQTTAAIIKGISTEDFPTWILSLAVVRKLCIADIRGMDSKNTLVTLLYRFIAQKIKGTENSFNSVVKEKQFNESASDDSNLSRLESYKLRHELTPGDVVILEYSLRDPVEVAKKLAPNIPEELVNQCLSTSAVLGQYKIAESQLAILQWVFKPIISPRGILYLSKPVIVKCLGVCQAILLHRGHAVLAGIVTARVSDNNRSFQITSVDSRARIPKELSDQIQAIYPFEKRTGSKTKVRMQNQTLLAIDKFVDKLNESSWTLTASDEYLPLINSGYNSRRFTVPHEIKVLVAAFILEIGMRSWKL